MGRPDTIKCYEVEGGWMIPCCSCGELRFRNDRANARTALITKCRACGNRDAGIARIRGSKFDKYLISENTWKWNCPNCNKEKIYTDYAHINRAVRKQLNCKSCALMGKGVKPKNKNLPYTKGKLRTWGLKIIKRDGCCQSCFSTEELHAHHIFSKHKFPEMALCLDNGITYCKKCHYEHHSLNGK